MSSFLDRLKKKDLIPATPEDDKKTQVAAQVVQSVAANPVNPPAAEQLKVDIFQTANAIVIYSQLAGAGVDDYSVTIDGDGDVVTKKGSASGPQANILSILISKVSNMYLPSVRGASFTVK